MARFYGTIQGARGPASRLGHTTSGLYVTAQSFSGDITVWLSGGDVNNEPLSTDMVTICARDHNSRQDVILYHGPVEHLIDQKGHDFLVEQMAKQALENEHASD